MNEPKNSHQEALNVAVVGATGAVGKTLLTCFEERGLPISRLVPLASSRSVGSVVRFRGAEIAVAEATPEGFDGVHFAFFAATGSLSKSLAPEAVARGAVVIDKSSTWRMDDDVPLVIPEINAAALDDHRGIIACPNCTTIGAAMVLEPIRRAAGLRRVVITTLQAVSGAGLPGIDELELQNQAWSDGEVPLVSQFAAPIAHNVLPICDDFSTTSGVDSSYTLEELKLRDEMRKIFALPDLDVTMTCVRVPVEVGHSAAILVETTTPLGAAEAQRVLSEFPGVRLIEDQREAPTPRCVAGSDEVWVGRVREDLSGAGIWLWEVSDNLRKGAATNSVQTAETVIERGLLHSG
ncbi:MAG: aspartate-semialdehyde dehydrogenase [Myxococcota bacterium]